FSRDWSSDVCSSDLFVAGGHDPIPTALGAGAAGWLLALVLRGPVGLIAMRSTEDQERAQTVVAASSGPLEELVRLGAVTVVGRRSEERRVGREGRVW